MSKATLVVSLAILYTLIHRYGGKIHSVSIVMTAGGKVLLDDYGFSQEQVVEWIEKSFNLAYDRHPPTKRKKKGGEK